MQDDQPVELSDFTTYYDASVPNWYAIGTTVIVIAVAIGFVVAVWLRVKRRLEEDR